MGRMTGIFMRALGKEGIWKTRITLEPGTCEYRFVVDGQWCNDPGRAEFRQNEFGDTRRHQLRSQGR